MEQERIMNNNRKHEIVEPLTLFDLYGSLSSMTETGKEPYWTADLQDFTYHGIMQEQADMLKMRQHGQLIMKDSDKYRQNNLWKTDKINILYIRKNSKFLKTHNQT